MSEANENDAAEIISVPDGEGTEAKDAHKPEPLHLKTKPIPALVTLIGGAIAAVDVFIQQYALKKSLLIIFFSLVVFLAAGEIVKALLDRIELPNPDAVDAEGNMVEKGKSEEGDSEEDSEKSDGVDATDEDGESPSSDSEENIGE